LWSALRCWNIALWWRIIGHTPAQQLKTIQEVITLTVFAVFSIFYLKEEFRWNYLAAFAMMVGAVFFMFKK
jgi:uncharacterized protein (DUF486 family)